MDLIFIFRFSISVSNLAHVQTLYRNRDHQISRSIDLGTRTNQKGFHSNEMTAVCDILCVIWENIMYADDLKQIRKLFNRASRTKGELKRQSTD